MYDCSHGVSINITNIYYYYETKNYARYENKHYLLSSKDDFPVLSAFFQGMEECALLILGKIPESALVATNAALQT